MLKPPTQETRAGSPTADQWTKQEIELAINAKLAEVVNQDIEALERQMLELDQLELPVAEAFVNGMYTRELLIPAGTLLTGRVHKHDYVDIMISGDIAVATPAGVKRMKGYNVCDGKAGRKRAGFAFEDTLWLTVHRIDKVEPDMENMLTFYSIGEYIAWQRQLVHIGSL